MPLPRQRWRPCDRHPRQVNQPEQVYADTKQGPLSSPPLTLVHAWRRTKRYCCNELLLQPRMQRSGSGRATAASQSASSAKSGRTTRPSGPAAAIPVATVRGALPRDGSGFRFDPIPGAIAVWTQRSVERPAAAAAMPDLRADRTLHRRVSTNATTKVRPIDDSSGNPSPNPPQPLPCQLALPYGGRRRFEL